MGSAKYLEKYRAKYGREPTAEELAAFTKKYKAKKEARKSEDKAGAAAAAPPPPEASSSKKAGKKASGPVTPSPSAGASEYIAAGQSSKATGKRKRSEAEASEMQRAKVLGKVAGLAIAASQSGVLAIAAAKKSKAHHLSEDAFKVAWTDHAAGAEALLATFEEGVEHLPEEQRNALLAPYRERLALSLTPADDVIERCRSKQAAKDAAKAAKRPPKTPKPPKEQVVDPAIRDAGLAVLAKHKYVFCLPCPPCLCAACPFALDALTDRCAFPVDSPRAGTMC